ncbi:MAG TPA: argininosuccinate lyase [Actinomycetota bacterium]|nr:argininosuccinate lyase [Actinomycetota bacterium]
MDERAPLWGGRFTGAPDSDLIRLTTSIGVDIALLPYDLAVTKAHARALEKAGLLGGDEVAAVEDKCDVLLDEFRAGTLRPDPDEEDVHSFVERELTERLGETGRRIHAGRSRNDLVATDLRLWSRDAAGRLIAKCAQLIETLCSRAEQHIESLMPGYTHLQRAQPVTLGFHLAAHGFALARDIERLEAARRAAANCPLGAGALATSTLDIDPGAVAGELGFQTTFDNAMDAVADRDFACDLAYAAALCGVHLSRLGEEVVLWTSSEFAFARLDDAWSTGSSMMPQKRNPDVAELARGRAAAGIGELTGLLGMVKGIPLAYNRDLQEDKALLFGIVARAESCLEAMTGLIATLTFDTERMEAAAASAGTWATDLAERLVTRGVAFRDAHEVVGTLVAELERSGRDIVDLAAGELARHDPRLEPSDVQGLAAPAAVAARNGPGGPAPERVTEQIAELRTLVRSSTASG